jgi:hypothetical protein
VRSIFLTVQCVIQGSAGFRCVSRIFEIIHSTLSSSPIPTPAFSTTRDWLLKLGLFNLTQPCEEGEWVWIIDCSIQMGAMKCLLILGVRMETLRERKNFTLSHSDLKPLVLKTVESCPGEVVKLALDEAQKKTGGAIAVVSDEGSELKRGVRLFQEAQVEVQKPIHLHDITHKLDLILKKELEGDEDWKKFTQQMTNTTQQLKLSTSSYLIPPKQRQKKRMRGEIDIVEWGINIIKYLDNDKATEFEKEKLSWVLNYRFQLGIYQEMAIIFDMCTEEVRGRGYSQKTIEILKGKRKIELCDERCQFFFSKVLKAIEQETNKMPENVHLLGCSEVIESVFGKFKQLEKNHCSGGLTSLVLSLPALVGDISSGIIKTAMEYISIKDVKKWVKENLGFTFWSQRRNAFNNHDKRNDYLESDDLIEEVIG